MTPPPGPTFFLCHASEDKEAVVRPVKLALEEAKIACWMDEEEILWGDSIAQKVMEGLHRCEFLILFVSESFLRKAYGPAELRAAVHRESGSREQRVLPVLVGGPEVWDRFTRDFALVAHKKFLEWTGDPAEIVWEARRLLGATATESNSSSSGEPAPRAAQGGAAATPSRLPGHDSLPLPTVPTPITDLDRTRFLEAAMAEVDAVFRQGLEGIRSQDPGWVVDREGSDRDFRVTLWFHGMEKGFCRVWLDRERENISFTETDRSGSGNSTNEEIRPVAKSGELCLQLLVGEFLASTTRKNDLTPTEAAEALWERFVRGIR